MHVIPAPPVGPQLVPMTMLLHMHFATLRPVVDKHDALRSMQQMASRITRLSSTKHGKTTHALSKSTCLHQKVVCHRAAAQQCTAMGRWIQSELHSRQLTSAGMGQQCKTSIEQLHRSNRWDLLAQLLRHGHPHGHHARRWPCDTNLRTDRGSARDRVETSSLMTMTCRRSHGK